MRMYNIYIRSTPHPVTVTTRIIPFLVGNPYKPSFVTVTGWGVDPIYIYIYLCIVYIGVKIYLQMFGVIYIIFQFLYINIVTLWHMS